jgi:hypothetical protein
MLPGTRLWGRGSSLQVPKKHISFHNKYRIYVFTIYEEATAGIVDERQKWND